MREKKVLGGNEQERGRWGEPLCCCPWWWWWSCCVAVSCCVCSGGETADYSENSYLEETSGGDDARLSVVSAVSFVTSSPTEREIWTRAGAARAVREEAQLVLASRGWRRVRGEEGGARRRCRRLWRLERDWREGLRPHRDGANPGSIRCGVATSSQGHGRAPCRSEPGAAAFHRAPTTLVLGRRCLPSAVQW